jgi:hypothetical protein
MVQLGVLVLCFSRSTTLVALQATALSICGGGSLFFLDVEQFRLPKMKGEGFLPKQPHPSLGCYYKVVMQYVFFELMSNRWSSATQSI